jgi:hypothetical protein
MRQGTVAETETRILLISIYSCHGFPKLAFFAKTIVKLLPTPCETFDPVSD